MLIDETKFTKDDNTEYIRIEFKHHKATIYIAEIPATYDKCPALRLAKAKQQVITDFLNSPEGKNFTEKEVLKAYSKVDKYFKDIYKEKYPHGGWRQGGRPKGSKTSNRTERLQQVITPDEKEFLIKALEDYRKSKAQTEDEMREALAPYLKQIDNGFGDDEEGRQKWRKRMLNMNPALYPQLLQHIRIFGVESLMPKAKK